MITVSKLTVQSHIPESFASYTFYPGTWTDAYSLASERQIKKNQLVTTIPLLMAQWKVSFEFKASTFGSGLRQILHMTTGGRARAEDPSTATELQQFGQIQNGDFSFHQPSMEGTAIPGGLVRSGSLQLMNGSTSRLAKNWIYPK